MFSVSAPEVSKTATVFSPISATFISTELVYHVVYYIKESIMVVSCTEYIFHGSVKSYAFKKCLNYYYKFLLERKYLLKQYQYRNIRKKQYCTFQRHWGVDIKNGSVIPAFPDHYWQVSAIFFCFTEVHFWPYSGWRCQKVPLSFLLLPITC